MLRPASELTFDDAPWMSSTLRQRPDANGLKFVHEAVGESLAEQLGARALRYLLLLEEKLTDTLPCPSADAVRATLSEAGHEAHLLLDLLEVADYLGARAVHFVLDRRRHPCQSLLSPTLAAFQGEALCMHLPGISLSAEEVCRLHSAAAAAAGGKGGDAASSGLSARIAARMSGAYAVSELSCIVSGPSMYLFDPSGKYLTSSVSSSADGSAGGGRGGGGGGPAGGPAGKTMGVGRAYPLVPNDLPNRFPDQFAPLAMFGFEPSAGRPASGTLLRFPLRSHSIAAHSSLSSQFWSVPRVRTLVHVLRRHAPTLLLGLDHIESASVSEWPASTVQPISTFRVAVVVPPQVGPGATAQRGALARDTAWRSSSFFGMLSGKSHQKEAQMLIDVTQAYRERRRKPGSLATAVRRRRRGRGRRQHRRRRRRRRPRQCRRQRRFFDLFDAACDGRLGT